MKKIFVFVITAPLITIWSCSDVLDKFPLDKPSQETFWTNASEINGGVVGCYKFLRETDELTYTFPISLDLMSDIGFPRQESNFKTIAKGEHDDKNYLIYLVWSHAYQGIGRCNLMLKVINEKSDILSEKQIKQFRGETLFLRAYYYTRLVTYFGDVPLVLEPVETVAEAAKFKRENKDVVIDQILLDYTEAANLLDKEYTSASEIGRATKGTANAYKARAALYFGKWDIAASAAKEVIDSKVYQLYPKYGSLFQPEGLWDADNKEIIFKMEFSSIIPLYHELPLYMQTRNMIGYASIVPTQNLVDSYHCIDDKNIETSRLFNKAKPFENRDPRLKLSILVPGERFGDFQFESHIDSVTCWNYVTQKRVNNLDCYANSQYTSYTGYYVRKYNAESYVSKKNKGDYPLILCRYAEVLLTYAEAKIESNDIDQTVVDVLNQIRRDRDDVKMPALSLADLSEQDIARKIVRYERKIELAFEGFRYTDLRRWEGYYKYANQPIMGRPFKGEYLDWPDVRFDENDEPVYNYQIYEPHPSKDYRIVENRTFVPHKHELWPIPERERNISPQLTQNQGY